ncbi:hypothetical protein QTN47_10990 [Danxiaibacter flavus]|uniref:Lipoprotein n=1 Tax=Danxiaibacter flavus TaxID=3049108 RepID=A0ABV3ZHZ3_9BACT|nr:hypothetical protein QNM32_10995 [Chitinophagaceae bacterium DXS]
MTKLLPLIALIFLFASCTRGYGLLSKAREKVKKSVCIFSEKSAEEMKCQKSMDEDNGQPASAAGKLSGISNWDARMLLQ